MAPLGIDSKLMCKSRIPVPVMSSCSFARIASLILFVATCPTAVSSMEWIVPQEMENLNSLERHSIQRAKCFMCIVRLQPYSKKVPSHNSLKACSGAVCYLPLSTKKTVETLDQVQSFSESLPVQRYPSCCTQHRPKEM